MNELTYRQEIVNLFCTAGVDANAAIYMLSVTLIVGLCGQLAASLALFLVALYFLCSARANVRRAEGINDSYRLFSRAEIDYLWNNC